jgi:16S rRNA (cytidine1402-2'-O)-methyltransferase
LSASFTSALQAASEAAAGQNYPSGTLYMVATPIGNLSDVTLRALHVLQLVDTVACEDTRHTQHLLRNYGIHKSSAQLLPLHQHNEEQASLIVVDRLRQGQRIAYVSDAGTPGISDPGARLAMAVAVKGLRLVPLPGASSVTALLSVAGMVGGQSEGVVFRGFLPTKSAERAQAVHALATDSRAVVLLEAPHRVQALAQALQQLGQRMLTVGRELTKQFEEIITLPAQGLVAWLAADEHRLKGEFAIVLHPAPNSAEVALDLRVLEILISELPLKTAVKLAAEITGQSRNALYEQALRIRDSTRIGPADNSKTD